MLDKYIFGDVARISPEAPVPVVRATHSSEQPGGAANVAMNIARLGALAQVIGFTGGDDSERLLAAGLQPTVSPLGCNNLLRRPECAAGEVGNSLQITKRF